MVIKESDRLRKMFFGTIRWLDKHDQRLSLPLQKHTSWPMTCTLIVFAHVFNRAYATIPLLTCFLIGAYRIDPMLYLRDYQVLTESPSGLQRFLYGVFFFLVYTLTLLCAVVTF